MWSYIRQSFETGFCHSVIYLFFYCWSLFLNNIFWAPTMCQTLLGTEDTTKDRADIVLIGLELVDIHHRFTECQSPKGAQRSSNHSYSKCGLRARITSTRWEPDRNAEPQTPPHTYLHSTHSQDPSWFLCPVTLAAFPALCRAQHILHPSPAPTRSLHEHLSHGDLLHASAASPFMMSSANNLCVFSFCLSGICFCINSTLWV